jgi:bacteriorhodopsin
MKKQVVFIAICLILFVSATAANFSAMASGSSAALIGFVLSLLLTCSLIVFSLVSKPKDKFINLVLIFTGLIAVTSILGMLKYNDIIASDFFIPILALVLTSFYGLTYILPLNLFYYVLIGLSMLGSAVLTSVLLKKEKGN